MKWIKKEDDYSVPIKSWCEDVEEGAFIQAINLSKHPVVFHHVSLMPDCHQGYGMPIGGVIACINAIIPNAVGVDIGCGMCAVKTDFKYNEIDTETIKKIMGDIRKVIPVGFSHQKENQDWLGFDNVPEIEIIEQEVSSAKKQLGTLGGGNHFIEIQKSENNYIWIMLHSGSRNFGYKIAKKYNEKAIMLCDKWFSSIPDKELAFLPIDTQEAQEYLIAMNYALDFAQANRDLMLKRVMAIIKDILKCNFEPSINIHHNFAALENHYNKNVYLHRKGATSAKKNQIGIIPGSMGSPSYIVEGLGNRESFMSCSHGAGRNMSRAAASNKLTIEECDKAMQGIVFGRWGKDRKGRIDLGEAPQAYKNIENVIESELDLIKPLVKLTPLGVIKG